MNILARSQQEFDRLSRIAEASMASPPSFAPPVRVDECPDTLDVVSHLPDKPDTFVRTEATERSLILRSIHLAGGSALRLCSLPCPVFSTGIRVLREGDLLRVRLRKKRGAILTPDDGPTISHLDPEPHSYEEIDHVDDLGRGRNDRPHGG